MSSSSDVLRSKIINIVHRPFKSLPLAIDIPRLAANFEVRRGTDLVWSPAGASPQETLRSLLEVLTSALDGSSVLERFNADYARYLFRDGHDVSKALERFMDEVLGGDTSRTVQLLKAANQAIIGPAVVELKLALGPAYMTKDVRGWWRTEVQLCASPSIRVLTRKRDICVRGTFMLEWTLSVLFVQDDASSALRANDVVFEVTMIRYGPALRLPTEAARLETLRKVLARFASASVLSAADETTDWQADAPPSLAVVAPSHASSLPLPSPPLSSTSVAATLSSCGSDQFDATPAAGVHLTASRSTPSVASASVSAASATTIDQSPSAPASSVTLFSSSSSSSSTSTAPPAPIPPSSSELTQSLSDTTPAHRTVSSEAPSLQQEASGAAQVRVIMYSNGDSYEGQLAADGRREGRGTYSTAQGDVYVGTYVAGQRHGHGVYTRKDGSRYEGEFRDGCPHGMGVYVFEDGSIYRGAFVKDEFHGRGRWSSIKGDFYEGDYCKGKRHGNGVLMVGGTRYEGQWEDDVRCGHGRLELSNGDWYEGGFVAGKFHGKGRYHFKASNTTVDATFRNGKPVSAKNGTV